MVNASSKKRRHENSASDEDESEQEYQVEAILDKRVKGKKTQYLLKWKGYSDADNTVKFFVIFSKNILFFFLHFIFQRNLYFFYKLQDKIFLEVFQLNIICSTNIDEFLLL
jgi:hypothetical protein